MGKINLCVALLLTTTLAQANSVDQASKAYAASYWEYLDVGVETRQSKDKVDGLQKQNAASQQKVTSLQGSLRQAEARLSQLPSLIQRERQQTQAKEHQVHDRMIQEFPEYSSVSQAQSDLEAKHQRLDQRRRQLESHLSSTAAPYDSQINFLESENRRLMDQSAHLQLENQQLFERNRQLRDHEIPETQARLHRAKQMKQSGEADRKLAETRVRLAEVEREIEEKGEKCRKGLKESILGQKKGLCRERDRLRDQREELKAIVDGRLINQLERQLAENQRELETNRRRFQINRQTMDSNDARVAQNNQQIRYLVEDKRIATEPIRREIAQVDFEIAKMQGRLQSVRSLASLQVQVDEHYGQIQRLEAEKSRLPAEIASLKADVQLAESDLVKTSQELAAETNRLNQWVAQQQKLDRELPELRRDLELSLDSGVSPTLSPDIDLSESGRLVGSYKDWSVIQNSFDVLINREVCKAETAVVSPDDSLSIKLQVVKLQSGKDFSEAMVAVTVEGRVDLSAFQNLVLQAKGSKNVFEMTWIPSHSASNRKVFLAKMAERRALLIDILQKLDLNAEFSDGTGEEVGVFSLRGSTNALRRGSNSLEKSCGLLMENF